MTATKFPTLYKMRNNETFPKMQKATRCGRGTYDASLAPRLILNFVADEVTSLTLKSLRSETTHYDAF